MIKLNPKVYYLLPIPGVVIWNCPVPGDSPPQNK
jgi:hypothetical protein